MNILVKIGYFLIAFMILCWMLAGCNEENNATDYTSRGSKRLLERPYREIIGEVRKKMKKDPVLFPVETKEALRDLQELMWVYYYDPEFFIYLSRSDNIMIAEEGVDNLQRFLESPGVRQELLSICRHKNDRFRDQALYFLSLVKDSAFKEGILFFRAKEMLGDESEPVRYRAVTVLGEINRREICSLIKGELNDPSPAVKGQAMLVLSEKGMRELIPRFQFSLGDSSPYVKSCAIAALANLRARECSGELMSLIDDRECTFYSVMYHDGNFYGFNGPQRTVQLSVVCAIEKLYQKRFSENIEECKKWWKTEAGN